jgi:hypothetical protein
MPRLHQYRVGSLIQTEEGLFQIMKIEKLKNAPMTYAVTYWTLGTDDYWIRTKYEHRWNGAHQLNEMLDDGKAKVVSY